MNWTENYALVVHAKQLWDEGHSAAQIGLRIGVTKNAVVGLAHRRGWSSRPSPIVCGNSGPRKPRARRVRAGESTLVPLPDAPAPLPETRFSVGGRISNFRVDDAKRDALRGPTLVSTAVAYDKVAKLRAQVSSVNLASRQFPPGRLCCWPIGEPRAADFRFREAAVTSANPYCEHHRSKAYTRSRDDEAKAA